MSVSCVTPSQALCNAHKLPSALLSFLLNPAATPRDVAARSGAGGAVLQREAAEELLEAAGVSEAMRGAMVDLYNPSQLAAVAAAVSMQTQFTLVQVWALSFTHRHTHTHTHTCLPVRFPASLCESLVSSRYATAQAQRQAHHLLACPLRYPSCVCVSHLTRARTQPYVHVCSGE